MAEDFVSLHQIVETLVDIERTEGPLFAAIEVFCADAVNSRHIIEEAIRLEVEGNACHRLSPLPRRRPRRLPAA